MRKATTFREKNTGGTLPVSKTIADGTLDHKGNARVSNIDPGPCKITFPNLHQDAWEKA
jgi:hypothetical protein